MATARAISSSSSGCSPGAVELASSPFAEEPEAMLYNGASITDHCLNPRSSFDEPPVRYSPRHRAPPRAPARGGAPRDPRRHRAPADRIGRLRLLDPQSFQAMRVLGADR